MITLQYRKGVDNKNYEDIKIPSANQVEKTVGMLNQQIRHILDTAIESDRLQNVLRQTRDMMLKIVMPGYVLMVIRAL